MLEDTISPKDNEMQAIGEKISALYLERQAIRRQIVDYNPFAEWINPGVTISVISRKMTLFLVLGFITGGITHLKKE
jgi:hypothetical protein